MAHRHIGQMQVADQVVLVTGAAVLSLVDVADETLLDTADAPTDWCGQHGNQENGRRNKQNGADNRDSTAIHTIEHRHDKNQ